MRVLDLGCGSGRDLASWGVNASDEITGLDIDDSHLAIAKVQFPNRTYLHGAGECLPFENESFDRVISGVALPYMSIQKTLTEIHRILVPGGGLSLSLHPPSFTIVELLHNALPKPVPTLFRLYVLANGLLFHCTGWTVGFLNGRTESFQTERGMRVALNRAGFVNPSFSRATGRSAKSLLWKQENRKLKVTGPFKPLLAPPKARDGHFRHGLLAREKITGYAPILGSKRSCDNNEYRVSFF
jgi:SAM-dependent methyltransferase